MLQIYVISAVESIDRRARIQADFKKLSIEPKLFDAIMGNQLSKEQREALVEKGSMLSAGEIGCALSHLAIFEEFLESENVSSIIVMEDDAYIQAEHMGNLYEIVEFVGKSQKSLVVLLYPTNHPCSAVKKFGTVGVYETLDGSCAHGYIINREAAKNILWAQRPVGFEMDAWAYYKKLGLISLYCTDTEVISLHQDMREKSIIDSMETRKHDKASVKLIGQKKDEFFRKRYKTFPLRVQLQLQWQRFLRHVQEYTWTKKDF